MEDSEHVLRARLRWVTTFLEAKSVTLTCRRCGISPPTLRKWVRRYQAEGEAGLRSRSRRPHNITYKVTDEHVEWIRHMRLERKLGPKRIQAELIRLHGLKLSSATVWKVLDRYGWKRLKRVKKPARPKSYSRPVPGDRVQIDTVKVAKNLFQYTATDDCTRIRVLALYPRRNAKNSVRFLREHVLKEFLSRFSASRRTGVASSSGWTSSWRSWRRRSSFGRSGPTVRTSMERWSAHSGPIGWSSMPRLI